MTVQMRTLARTPKYGITGRIWICELQCVPRERQGRWGYTDLNIEGPCWSIYLPKPHRKPWHPAPTFAGMPSGTWVPHSTPTRVPRTAGPPKVVDGAYFDRERSGRLKYGSSHTVKKVATQAGSSADQLRTGRHLFLATQQRPVDCAIRSGQSTGRPPTECGDGAHRSR